VADCGRCEACRFRDSMSGGESESQLSLPCQRKPRCLAGRRVTGCGVEEDARSGGLSSTAARTGAVNDVRSCRVRKDQTAVEKIKSKKQHEADGSEINLKIDEFGRSYIQSSFGRTFIKQKSDGGSSNSGSAPGSGSFQPWSNPNRNSRSTRASLATVVKPSMSSKPDEMSSTNNAADQANLMSNGRANSGSKSVSFQPEFESLREEILSEVVIPDQMTLNEENGGEEVLPLETKTCDETEVGTGKEKFGTTNRRNRKSKSTIPLEHVLTNAVGSGGFQLGSDLNHNNYTRCSLAPLATNSISSIAAGSFELETSPDEILSEKVVHDETILSEETGREEGLPDGTSEGNAGIPDGTSEGNAGTPDGTSEGNAGIRKRRKSCKTCDGCIAEDCGSCLNCRDKKKFGGSNIRKQKCVLKVCNNMQESGLIKTLNNQINAAKKKSSPRLKATKNSKPKPLISPVRVISEGKKDVSRYKNCGDCSSCCAPACGKCQSCLMNTKYQKHPNILAPAKCTGKTCKNPINLFYTKHIVDQEDGVCPIKEVAGEPFDYRCHICLNLPRPGCANKSELYRHYSTVHFAEQLKEEFGICQSQIQQNCPICQVNVGKKNGILSHLGQKHNEVEKYLPSKAKVPETLKRKSNVSSRKVSKRKVSTRTKTKRPSLKKSEFPSVPEGYNAEKREIFDTTFQEEKSVVVDGFEISNEVDEGEERLFISRGSEKVSKLKCNFTDEAVCQVCRQVLENILVAAEHVHEHHGIKGRSKHQLLDFHYLINAGYIVIGGR